MRKLQADHREEVKLLSKKHRNREQFTRVKREAVTAVVDRGVSEREKLGQLFETRKEELQQRHEAVREQFQEHREKVSGSRIMSVYLYLYLITLFKCVKFFRKMFFLATSTPPYLYDKY